MLQYTKSNLELKSEKKLLSESRKYSRLNIDLGHLVELDLKSDHAQSTYLFKGLVLDSSLGGCGILVVDKKVDLLKENQTCYLKFPEVNQLGLKSKIIWKKKIENNIFRLGLEFIDEGVF